MRMWMSQNMRCSHPAASYGAASAPASRCGSAADPTSQLRPIRCGRGLVPVRLRVFDASGRVVRSLADSPQCAGTHRLTVSLWQACMTPPSELATLAPWTPDKEDGSWDAGEDLRLLRHR